MIPMQLPFARPGLKSPSDLTAAELTLWNEASAVYSNHNQGFEEEYFDESSFTADLSDSFLIEQSDDLLQYITGNNCTLAGCNSFCEKQHSVSSSCTLDDPLMIIVAPDQLFDYRDVSTADEIEPYTPKNDHCYSAPMKEEPYEQSYGVGGLPTPPTSSGSSQSDTEDGEEDIDVVTCDEPPASCKPPSRKARSRDIRRHPKRMPLRKSSASQKASSRISKKSRKLKAQKPKRNSNSHRQTAMQAPPSRLSSSYFSRHFSSEGTNSEDDSQDAGADEVKRHEHNKLERKRRLQQRYALQNLRICIPSLADTPKAAKVSILQHATDYVRKLKIQERTFREQKIRESQRKSELMAKLAALRKGLLVQ